MPLPLFSSSGPARIFPRSMLAIGLAMSMAQPAKAQTTGIAAVDSANVARAAWARGAKAYSANDRIAAQREMTHAAAAWPTQASYLWGRLLMSALRGDSANVIASLRGYAAVGLGRSIWKDTIFRAFLDLPSFQDLARTLDANIAPITASHIVGRLADSTFWPEGVDFDPRTKSYYLASIRQRTIAELRSDGTTRELWPRGRADIGAVMGVRVDSARGVLWATMSGVPQMLGYIPADSALAALVRVRIADGVIEKRWNVSAARGGHALGDLALGPAGDVFMTDSNEPVLYRLRPGVDTLERMSHPLFRSLQGMAATADGRTLYVADYSHGLLRIDLATGDVIRLADAPGSTSLGCDGLVIDGTGAIIAVQNGVSPARVMRFVIAADRRRVVSATVLDRNLAIADEPTIGTIAHGQFVYVANSQWDKYDDDGRRKPSVPLTAPVLLAVPLPR